MNLEELSKAISDWAVILQSVIGSAIFWLILEILTHIWKMLSRLLGNVSKDFEKESLLQEWIYRKYTSRTGLINITQGFFITFDHVFRYLITGLIFASVAVLIAGIGKLSFGIILTAAIYYLFRALSWLTPKKDWSSDNLSDHWKKVAELEKRLLGKMDEDTQGFLNKYSDNEKEKVV